MSHYDLLNILLIIPSKFVQHNGLVCDIKLVRMCTFTNEIKVNILVITL